MTMLRELLIQFNNFMWGFPILVLLVGTGIYYTYRLRFLQIHRLLIAMRHAVSPQRSIAAEGDVSSFHALCIALASTVGTGNIIGVALAIALGGPGALFWMWITGLFGMATKYAEAMLAVKYRVKREDGTMAGGPMYYLERGLNNMPLARSFAFLAAVSALVGGTFPQANSMVEIFEHTFRIPRPIAAIGLGLIVAYIVMGGIKRIARIAGIVIPFIAVFFITGTSILVLANVHLIGPALRTIFQDAFSLQSASGGFLGSSMVAAINHGVRRGVFSNEQGNGTSPIAAAIAITNSPVEQGLINMLDVFIDTHIINVIMGLLIVMSGAYETSNDTLQIVTDAFHQVTALSALGEITLTVSLIFFAFTTIIAWNFFGTQCVRYLLGAKSIPLYKLLFIATTILSGFLEIELVFLIADASIALMVIPNALGVLMLSSEVVKDTRTYFSLPKN